jgi:GT2 family glycosyltransferase
MKVIGDCLQSIYSGTRSTEFEVIVSDNGSTDGSPEFIRTTYPRTRVIENRANLRFSKGNNVGIQECSGDYILILNPDTIIHDGTLDRWIEFADRHPEAGGFGLRVLNPDGSYQVSARPFPTVRRDWVAALCLGSLGHLSDAFTCDIYVRWKGDTERTIDWHSGCCLLVRGNLLRKLAGFDEQFRYYYEDVDLCRRIWNSGSKILFTPAVTITHLGGQSTSTRFPIPFELDKYRNRYRYFYKYFGKEGARACRRYSLVRLRVRQIGYGLRSLVKPSEGLKRRLELYRAAIDWNRRVDPVDLVERGTEPESVAQIPLQAQP